MTYVANAAGTTDGVMYNVLNRVNTDLSIVLVTRPDDFKFNEDLRKLDRYVLVDMVENGWDFDWKRGTHFFGNNTEYFTDLFPGEEWMKFENFVTGNQPVLYLKRELLKKDETDFYQPIDYPCWVDVQPVQSKEEFDSRVIDLFYFFGRSNENRLRIHGEIWINASKRGYSVCDNIYQFNEFMKEETGRKIVSMHMPHYFRSDIRNLLKINGMSKLSLSPAGAGLKTFRHCESSVNSILVKQKDNLAYSYDWKIGNCIQYDEGNELNTIFHVLGYDELYDIYCGSVENCRKYQVDQYVKNYIEHKIKSR